MLMMLEPEARMRRGDLEVSQVPPAVRKAAEKAAPGATWSSASSQIIYELEGKDAKGRAVVVEVDDVGEVGEVTTELSAGDVPSAVTNALRTKMPRFKVDAVFESRQDGKVTGYSFEGRRPRDKEAIGVFVSLDGKTIEVEEDA
jgi:hypothetical protein